MTRDEFDAAIAAIEETEDGGPYVANFHMTSGQIWRKAAWGFVDGSMSLISLQTDGPPVYIAIGEIEAIHLCA